MASLPTVTSDPFNMYVRFTKQQFPKMVQVVESSDEEILKGDIMKVQSVLEKYQAEYDDPVSHQKMQSDVPGNLGGFKTISELPANYVYESVQEMALDFPPTVRVLQDFQIQEHFVKRHDGLKLKRIKRTGELQILVCQHFPSEKTLKLPFHLKGQFQKRTDNTVYSVEQLKNRMPVRVKLDRDMGATIRRSQIDAFCDIPDDGVILLTKSTVVQAEHWHQPSSRADVYIGHRKTDKVVQVNRNFTVTEVDLDEGQFGPIQHIVDVTMDTVAIVCSEHGGYECSGISRGTMVEVKGSEKKEGVIVRGTNKHLLVSKDHNKSTKFRIRGKEYPTPRDLWKANYNGEVTANQTVKSPKGFRENVRSIYQHDRVQLVRDPDEVELPKFLSTDDFSECEVVDVCRNFSKVKARLGKISVDANANVCFEEPPPVVGQHSLADVLRYGEIPMDIALCDVSQLEEMSDGDRILVCESPFRVVKECEYTVTYVGTLEGGNKVYEIPDFSNMQVRPAKTTNTLQTDLQFEKPNSCVIQLSSEEYAQLVGVPLNEPVYNEIEEEIQSLSSSFNSGLSRLVSINSTSVTPPQSPLLSPSSPVGFTSSIPSSVAEVPKASSCSYGTLHTQVPLSLPLSLPPGALPVIKKTPPPTPQRQGRDPHKTRPVSAPATQLRDPQKEPPPRPPKRKTSADEEGKRRLRPIEEDKVVDQRVKETKKSSDRHVPRQRSFKTPPVKALDVQQRTTSSAKDKTPPPVAPRRNRVTTVPVPARAPVPVPDPNPVGAPAQAPAQAKTSAPATAPAPVPPKVVPPSDKVITSFNAVQLAGMMRHLDFGNSAVSNCIDKNINGPKLIDIFRNTASDEDLCHELKLDKLSEVHCLRLFVNQSELSDALPKVSPQKMA